MVRLGAFRRRVCRLLPGPVRCPSINLTPLFDMMRGLSGSCYQTVTFGLGEAIVRTTDFVRTWSDADAG